MSRESFLSVAALQRAASIVVAAAVVAVAMPMSASAASWRDHARPFNFEFGNGMDENQ